MATHNGATHLDEQLASIAAQDHTNWALWVSDDGSTDGTRDKVRAFAACHTSHDIRLFDGPQKGAAANFLSLICHPDLPPHPITLSDQDDIWRPEKLRLALDALDGLSEPAVYSAQSEHITVKGAHIRNSRPHHGQPSFGNALVQNRVAGHCATLNPAALALLRRIGPVDVPFHDWWIYLLVTGCGGQVIVHRDIVLSYRQHAQNVLGGNQRRFASLMRLLMVFSTGFKVWQNRNLLALETAHPYLQPQARAILKAWTKAPTKGFGRARLMKECGLNRDTPIATAVLRLAALLGRV